VYCSIDPATAILEVAVHKGFAALDTVPHVLTAIDIAEPSSVHVVQPTAIPNSNWLRPGIPSAGQQAFGDDLLAQRKFVVIPSTVSSSSWNLIFVGTKAAGAYSLRSQERFVLDLRLHRVS
jgi:RES domain-containing protein